MGAGNGIGGDWEDMNMKTILKWAKRVLCLVIILMILFADSSALFADAAGFITVTNALSGKKIGTYDNLQDAFDVCERGCIVSIGQRYTMTANVELKAEIMLSGHLDIVFGEYQILLSGKGAIFVDTRFNKSKYVGASNPYSEVDWMDESGGYIYYLITQTPDFGENLPKFTTGSKLLGVDVDAESNVIYQDGAVDGILASDMTKLVSFPLDFSDEAKAEHAIENVAISFDGTVSNDGRTYIANGTTMTASATNYDYEGSVDKVYTIILLGDVNGNGRVDAADASLIARHAAGSTELTGNALLAADANRDGAVTAEDAQLICEKYIRRDSYRTPL